MCPYEDGSPYIIVGVTPKSAVCLFDYIAAMGLTSYSDDEGDVMRVHIYNPFPLTVEDFAALPIVGIMYVQDGNPTDRAQDQAFV